jgi:uncharacterized membrane protein YfcA
VAGLVAGFLGGLVGMPAPPLVFFALAHAWDRDPFRAFLWMQFLLATPVVAGLLAYRFGLEVLLWVGVGALVCPVLRLGSKVGWTLTQTCSRERLRLAALGVLFAIAPTSMARRSSSEAPRAAATVGRRPPAPIDIGRRG